MPLPRSAGISFRGFGSIPMKGSCRNGPTWRSASKAWRVTFPLLVQIGFGRYHNITGAREFAWYRSHGSQASGAIAAGETLSEQNKLTDSFAALTQLAKLSPKDSAVSSLLGNVRGRLVQQHYNQGIRLYREEKLAAAISEWRSVLQYDPNHE